MATLSIDGIGFRGPPLPERQDPRDLGQEVFLPLSAETASAAISRHMALW
jgi:hypothetical protein